LDIKYNPLSWLYDSEGRDQLSLRFAEGKNKHETHIVWNDPLNRPGVNDQCRQLVYDGSREKQRGKVNANRTHRFTTRRHTRFD
jgi:hypothetical protein